jgi:zinc protease
MEKSPTCCLKLLKGKTAPSRVREANRSALEHCRRAARAGLVFLALFFLSWTARAGSLQEAGGQDEVLRGELKNGLRVVIVKNRLAPVVTTVMNYLVGSNETPLGFPGTAHAQEHMMFRGSPGLSANQLADISAAMGGSFDADTQQTVTQYFFTVPSEDLDAALHIEAIRMRGVLDTEKLWEEERGAIEQEVARDLSNPVYVFYTELLAAMFKGTVYAHDALGTRPSFEKTTGAMLRAFHETWYVPNNALLVIVGDIKPPEVLQKVKDLFGSIPARKTPGKPEVRFEPVEPKTLELKTDLPYSLAIVAFRLPGFDSPDYAASEILADVLASERGRLYALVPEGKALGAGFSLNSLPKAGLGYAYAAFPAGGNGEAVLGEVKAIISETVKEGVSPDLVEAAKKRELAEAQFQKNSISGLAMAWSEALAIEGRESPEDDLRAIARVSGEDINSAARKYLDLGHAVTAVLTSEPSGKPFSSKAFGAPESFAPKKTRPVKLPAWADKALKRLEVPASTVRPEVSVLSNGIKLIVQPETISDTVSVFGRIKNNPYLEIPRGKEGVDRVLARLFDFGTTSLDRVAFQKALDDIAADESAGTDFSLEVLTDHLDRGIELLADNELRPALPEPALKIVKNQLVSSIAGELQSPDYLAGRALDKALLPRDDPALRQATPASVSALSLEDVKDYYQKVFRPDLTTIVVIGKVKPDRARAVIEKHFGAWKSAGPRPGTNLPPVPPNEPAAVRVPDASRVQDSVMLAETIGLKRGDPDYYALELGNHILGGAFYATRLYRDLREERGLVYYVSSSFEIGKTRSFYAVNYGCDPGNVAEARAIVVRDLKEMQTTLASPHELEQARAMLLREIPLAESSLSDIAQGLILRSTEGLPLDEPTEAARKYLELSAEQVKAAFARWVRPDSFVEVTQGPAAESAEIRSGTRSRGSQISFSELGQAVLPGSSGTPEIIREVADVFLIDRNPGLKFGVVMVGFAVGRMVHPDVEKFGFAHRERSDE